MMNKPYYIYEIEQGDPAWISLRHSKIGASDVPVIMCKSPWSTPNQLYMQKLGLEHVIESYAMRRGKEREAEARDAFVRHIGVEVSPKVLVSNIVPYMMASLDGLSEDGKVCVEIKNCNLMDHASAQLQQVPEKYYPQVQAQLFVSGLDQMFYFSYLNESNFECVTVKRDEKFIEKMLIECQKFWVDLKNLIEPELIDKDYVCMDDNHDFVVKSQNYQQIDREIKSLEDQKEKIRAELISMANDQNCKADEFKMTKYTKKGNIDYSKIEELKNINLEKYRKKDSIAWRFS